MVRAPCLWMGKGRGGEGGGALHLQVMGGAEASKVAVAGQLHARLLSPIYVAPLQAVDHPQQSTFLLTLSDLANAYIPSGARGRGATCERLGSKLPPPLEMVYN